MTTPVYSDSPQSLAVPPSGTPTLSEPYYAAPFSAAWTRFWAKYATFSGRASRSEYWKWVLLNSGVYLVLGILTAALASLGAVPTESGSQPGPLFGLGATLVGIWYLSTLVPNIALTVRRLHDAGFSGWLYLLNLALYIGSLIVFIFTLLPSKAEGARYDRVS